MQHKPIKPAILTHMATYPELDELLAYAKKSGSKELLKINRAIRSSLSSLFLLAFSIAVFTLVNLYYENIKQLIELSFLDKFSPQWLYIISFGYFLEILRRFHNNLYIVETERLTCFSGRLALSYMVPSIKYPDIRSIVVDQDIFGRMFDYGDIWIGTASEGSYELCLKGVVSPRQLAKIIDHLRTHNVKARGQSISSE